MDTSLLEENKKRFILPSWLSFLANRHSAFYYYLMLVGMGMLFFGVSLFSNYFTTPFTGDYVLQQYAFYTNGYDDWWHFFKTGEFVLYDTNTFLGASNIGSNSFYYLFDPFFMPVLLFPRSIIPQAMAIMTILKMALAGLIFSLYMKYLGIKPFSARLAGLMYAFCGWTTWYLWFNHFTGVAVIFPLILLGVEKVLNEKKPFILSIALFVLGLTNFFFFFTFTICAFLYAMFRFFQRLKTYNVKEAFTILGIGFLGFSVGILLASIVVIPAMMVALHAPRATGSTYLPTLLEALKNNDYRTFFKYIFSWECDNTPYRIYYPILDFIFPVMSDRGTPLTKLGNETYDNIAGSLFCFSPIIIFFIPALISSIKKKHYSPLIATILFSLMLFTPFCYYAFHGFTYAYSRWTLFVTTSLIAYVAFYIDRIKQEINWHIFIGAGFALIMTWASIIIAIHMTKTYENFSLRYSYPELGEYGFTIIEGVLLSMYVVAFSILTYCFFHTEKLKAVMTFAVMIEVVIMGATTLCGHGYENYMNVNGGYENNKVFQTLIDRIQKDDPTYYRCYSSQTNGNARNDSMRHNYNGIGMFHSIYNFNLAPFLNWSQINDYNAPSSYSGLYMEKRQDLDTFLGVKYYFVNKDKAFYGDSKAEELKADNYRANVPLGFKDISDRYPNDRYYVYENENFIKFAFSYDKVAVVDNINNKNQVEEPTRLLNYTFENEELYLKTALIGRNNIDKVKEYIPEENIASIDSYEGLLDVKLMPTSYYETKYYDIHHDVSSDRLEASSREFVSHLLELSNYDELDKKPDKSKYNSRYVTVMNLKETFPYDENGIALFLYNSYLDESDINVYLVTKNELGEERFLTFDNHNDNGFSINWSSRKNWRGFYSAATYDENGNKIPASKISKIIIVSRKTELENYRLAYKLGTDVNKVIDNLKAYPITDVNYKTNHFDFKTNFDSRRIVVTQIPYEEGWSLRANYQDGTSKEVEILTAQGGFVSFVSELGDVTYSLDYYTPYLALASIISGSAMFIYIMTLMSYLYISLNWNNQKIGKDSTFSRKIVKFQLF